MILVVDDDKGLTELLCELLEQEGFTVCIANDGAVAYSHLKDPKCKGLLLDIHMPGFNGAELLMLMASDSSRLPVVVMTANTDFDEAELKEFPNVRKVLYKPLYAEDVLKAVKEYMLNVVVD